jgi:hypothetical protein
LKKLAVKLYFVCRGEWWRKVFNLGEEVFAGKFSAEEVSIGEKVRE